MDDDPLGIGREHIITRSGVREVFTPHRPIREQKLLRGRLDKAKEILAHLNTPGQHGLLFGERGVGKTSLANVVGIVMEATTGNLWRKRCDSEDNFVTVLQPVLSQVGAELPLAEVEATNERGGEIGTRGLRLSRRRAGRDRYTAPGGLSPSVAAEKVKGLKGMLLVDEADALRDPQDRRRLSEFVKHLSDEDSNLKVLIVGIAETGGELTAGHPSTGRCLQETELEVMTNDELREIIAEGADALGLGFDSAATDAIVELSSGFPHFTHLLASQCAEEAIVDGRVKITLDHVRQTLAAASKRAEGALGRSYDQAVRSFETDNYRLILMAAATLDGPEFRSVELREAYAKLTGEPITQGSLNNYLQRLVSDDGSTVLRRLSKGIYRFEDPRMGGYVRIANGMLPTQGNR